MKHYLLACCLSFAASPAWGQAAPQLDPAAKTAEVGGENAVAEIPKVSAVFDPGSHTRPITALGFSADQSRLITVAEDSTIQIWSTATGDRLDILRLPGYGHELQHNGKEWDVAAISRDGRYVAVGGGQKGFLTAGERSSRARLIIVDLAQRTVHPVIAPPGYVSAVAFAPDNRLAVAADNKPQEIHLYPAPSAENRPVRRRQAVVLTDAESGISARFLHFSPDGKRLVSAADQRNLVVWDLTGAEPKVLKRLEFPGHTTALGWSNDSKQFVRTFRIFGLTEPNGLEVWSADGARTATHLFSAISALEPKSIVSSLQFVSPTAVVMIADDGRVEGQPGATAIRFDLAAAEAKPLISDPTGGKMVPQGAVSSDLKLSAMTVAMGLDALVFRTDNGQLVSRCGAASPIPSIVAWSAAGKPPQIAWSERFLPGRFNAKSEDLQYAFDLQKLELAPELNSADFQVGGQKLGEWSLSRTKSNTFELLRGETVTGEFQGGNTISAATLIPQGGQPPLVALSLLHTVKGAANLTLARSDGSDLARLLPRAAYFRDLAPSPDGRYLLASNGSHRLCVYRTDGTASPLLSFARVHGKWAAWTSAGYYTASPGGEKMIGWAVSNGPDKLATFYPAGTFARQFQRPEILARALALGSLEQALKSLETRAPAVEELLPPECELKLVRQAGALATVQATTAPAGKQAVLSLRLLLDGRPLSGGRGYQEIRGGEPATATWDVEIPEGSHELKLLARGAEGSAKSAPLLVSGPPGRSPVLHRLCVGVNQYDVESLRLHAAARDAADVFAALETYCVGTGNRFSSAGGKLLLDYEASSGNVLQALAEIRKQAKPGDLVVFMFAGHGVRQQGEYYLLTREADLSRSLKDASLSGEALRGALREMDCPVFLLMDACYAASGVKGFLPATDSLTSNLTDEAVGVTVMAAAMANEKSSATVDNGLFTAAFLKALRSGHGDPYDGKVYSFHLFSTVFSEVRHASGGRQNPHLTSPWTDPPIVLRQLMK